MREKRRGDTSSVTPFSHSTFSHLFSHSFGRPIQSPLQSSLGVNVRTECWGSGLMSEPNVRGVGLKGRPNRSTGGQSCPNVAPFSVTSSVTPLQPHLFSHPFSHLFGGLGSREWYARSRQSPTEFCQFRRFDKSVSSASV